MEKIGISELSKKPDKRIYSAIFWGFFKKDSFIRRLRVWLYLSRKELKSSDKKVVFEEKS